MRAVRTGPLAIGLGVLGAVLVAVAYAQSWQARAQLRLPGLALMIAAGLVHFAPATGALWRDSRRAVGRALKHERAHLSLLVLIVLGGALVRLRLLAGPVMFDEADTLFEFVRRPVNVGLTFYPTPNNHVFHTLLEHTGVALFGTAEWVIRLPAFLAGVAVIPMTYVTTRVLYNRDAALIAAGLVAPSAALVEYSLNGRGYTMVCAAFLALVALGHRLIHRPCGAAWVLWVVIAALGFYTLPIMIFPIAITALWMAIAIAVEAPRAERPALLRALLLALVTTAVLAFLLWAPTIDQSGWSFREPTTAGKLLRKVSDLWTAAWPAWVTTVLAVGLVAGVGIHRRIARRSVPVVVGLAAIPVLLLVLPVPPFARSWLFLLPLVSGIAAAGLVGLMRAIDRRGRFVGSAAVALAFGALVGRGLAVGQEQLPNSTDPPLRDGKAATRYLKRHLSPGEQVVIGPYEFPAFTYYFDRQHLDRAILVADRIVVPPGSRGRAVVVVNHSLDETLAARLALMRRGGSPPVSQPVLVRRFPRLDLYEVTY